MPTGNFIGPLRALARSAYRTASTEELISRFVQRRDTDAFTVLVERFRTFVFRRCQLVVHHDDLALDATQETFVALAKYASRVLEPGKLARWLEKVARNKAKNIRRREHRLRRLTASIIQPAFEPDQNGERLQQRELQEQVNQALALLPRKYREALELCFLDGLTQREVAAILDLPQGTLAWRVQHGLERLKKILCRSGWAPSVVSAVPCLLAQQAEAAVSLADSLAKAVLTKTESTKILARFGLLGFFGSRGLVTIMVMTALIFGGGIAVWYIAKSHEEQIPPHGPIVSRNIQEETLQQRYLRVLDDEVLPQVIEALRAVALGNGAISIVSRGAMNHHVYCIVEVRHFPSKPGWSFSTKYDLKYDALGRGFSMHVDLFSTGQYRPVDPARPVVLWRNPLTGYELQFPVEATKKVVKAFEKLPLDVRAISECTHHWESLPKPDEKGTFFPGLRADSLAGNSRRLFICTENAWLWATDLHSEPLRWHCIGQCRGRLVADERSLFTMHDRLLLTRPADGEIVEWTPAGKMDFEPDVVGLAVAGGYVFCIRSNSELRGRAVDNVNGDWEPCGNMPSRSIFGYGDALYCETEDHRLLTRPATLIKAPWTVLEKSLPSTKLAIAGGRLWAIVKKTETISIVRSRAMEEPSADWQLEGTVVPVKPALWQPPPLQDDRK